MNQFNNINPADNRPAASETTVEQPQPQQVHFEQQLADVQQLGPIYAHRQLYDVTQEDDRLIQAASGAALERGPPPGSTTISIYDRRLRKLAEALKQDGKSMATLDDDTLLDCAKKLLPNDKVIAPALLMVSRYRKPGATVRITTHYRPSHEDERLIRKAAEAGFGRGIDAKTVGNYASSLRKLATALRPLSIAKLSADKLRGHADTLFPDDKKLRYALNRLRDYRAIIRQDNLEGQGGGSHLPTQPAAHSSMLTVENQPLGNAADQGVLLAGSFNAPQVWGEMGLAAQSPIQSVAQDVLFDDAERSGELAVAGFDAPLLWQGVRAPDFSSLQRFAQDELFDATDRESLLAAAPDDQLALWRTMSSASHSNLQSADQAERFHGIDRDDLPPGMAFDAPELASRVDPVVPSPVQSVAQEELLEAADLEGFMVADDLVSPEFWRELDSTANVPIESAGREELLDAATSQRNSRLQNLASEQYFARMIDQGGAALATTPLPVSESFDASLVVPHDFSHGNQPAPDMMRSKLGHWGLLPDATQPVKTYDIYGEPYTAVLGPGGHNDIQLIHLRSLAVGDTFDVSFAVPKDFSHCTQPAPDMMLSQLGNWDFLPDAENPVMNYEIAGQRYTAVLGPKGPNDVQLIHHPRFALRGEAALATPTAPLHTYGGPVPGFNPSATLELRKDAPSALGPNLPLPSAASAWSHQSAPQVPELGELFGQDWRHGPREASPLVIDMLQDLGLLPSQGVPMTCFLIHGQPYTAESLPGGRILLFHRPQFD
ncbi:hypothetical protein J2R76_004087 [Bradyrhizobium sp. USDA 4532]|uniref:hypothetical protein n=1 Tax=unclassified Bradyrhizobium TaxID=2631580 RepID=UPI00209F86A6|nr:MULTISPECIES: hypothetical protein [unclassified Bradyrhizobium]MCP1835747.1 hypothetical protein [Bradyrhizobium sp. USDA 4545]MCP1920496.1 hypothetical protein [Bradyrhizobium sp. USDA 4532]